jgi:hypothetical protein
MNFAVKVFTDRARQVSVLYLDSPHWLGLNPCMTKLQDLTVTQLQRAVALKEQIETLQQELGAIGGNGTPATPAAKTGGMSAAGRARISAAAKARWARVKGTAPLAKPAKKGGMSEATKAKLRAMAKARWAKIKGAAAPASKPAKKRTMSAAGRAAISAAAKAMWARKAKKK